MIPQIYLVLILLVVVILGVTMAAAYGVNKRRDRISIPKIRCAKCNTRNKGERIYCRKCGSLLRQTIEATPALPATQPPKTEFTIEEVTRIVRTEVASIKKEILESMPVGHEYKSSPKQISSMTRKQLIAYYDELEIEERNQNSIVEKAREIVKKEETILDDIIKDKLATKAATEASMDLKSKPVSNDTTVAPLPQAMQTSLAQITHITKDTPIPEPQNTLPEISTPKMPITFASPKNEKKKSSFQMTTRPAPT